MPQDRGPQRDEQRLAAVSGLDDPVRRGLYDYICGRSEPVCRDEVAAATGVGRPLVAYHLDKLVRLGLLTADYRRPAGRRGPGAGRPAKVYARSAREFTVSVPPRDYELAARLLADAVAAEDSGAAMAGLARVARERGMALARAGSTGQGAQPGQACHDGDVVRAVESILAAHGFEPCRAGEAGSGTTDIRLRNCPFHHLAKSHPGVVCAMNLALLDGVLQGAGPAGLRAVLDPAPDRCCVAIRSDSLNASPLDASPASPLNASTEG